MEESKNRVSHAAKDETKKQRLGAHVQQEIRRLVGNNMSNSKHTNTTIILQNPQRNKNTQSQYDHKSTKER